MMSDRFRDLEVSKGMRTKDFVLMATVTNFDELPSPGKTDLKQFAELFEPLFLNSSGAARQMAVAALSKSKTLPASIALFIGCQPIEIAAPFLATSQAIDDDFLIRIAEVKGTAHTRVIAARGELSPILRHALTPLLHKPTAEMAGLPVATQQAREDRFMGVARQNDSREFMRSLAEELSCSLWLAAKIMLDVSGRQLATALIALAISRKNIEFILTGLYPHLTQLNGKNTSVSLILDPIDANMAVNTIKDWVDRDASIEVR